MKQNCEECPCVYTSSWLPEKLNEGDMWFFAGFSYVRLDSKWIIL